MVSFIIGNKAKFFCRIIWESERNSWFCLILGNHFGPKVTCSINTATVPFDCCFNVVFFPKCCISSTAYVLIFQTLCIHLIRSKNISSKQSFSSKAGPLSFLLFNKYEAYSIFYLLPVWKLDILLKSFSFLHVVWNVSFTRQIDSRGLTVLSTGLCFFHYFIYTHLPIIWYSNVFNILTFLGVIKEKLRNAL